MEWIEKMRINFKGTEGIPLIIGSRLALQYQPMAIVTATGTNHNNNFLSLLVLEVVANWISLLSSAIRVNGASLFYSHSLR